MNNWGGGGSGGRIEENPELSPLDEWGNERQPNNGGNGGNGGNKWGNFFNRGNNNGGGGGGSWLGVIVAGIIFFLIFFVMFGNGGSGWTSIKRTFSNTPMENLNGMFNSIQEVETVNKKKGKFDAVYDKKRLIGEEVALNQPDKEYLIYVYTEDAKMDKEFNEFVKEYQKDIPIYKISYGAIRDNIEIALYTANGGYKPYLISVVDYGKGAKLVDAVIDNEKQLKNVPKYFEDVVAENNFKRSEIHKDKND